MLFFGIKLEIREQNMVYGISDKKVFLSASCCPNHFTFSFHTKNTLLSLILLEDFLKQLSPMTNCRRKLVSNTYLLFFLYTSIYFFAYELKKIKVNQSA